MVNLERAHAFRKGSGDIDVSDEVTGITIWASAFTLHANVGPRGFGVDSIHPDAGVAFAFTANADVLAVRPIGYPQNANPFSTFAGSLHTYAFAIRKWRIDVLGLACRVPPHSDPDVAVALPINTLRAAEL